MKLQKKFHNPDFVLFGIVGLALVLRLVGIDYGLPFFFVGDEQSQLGAALVMLKDFNLIPATNPGAFNLLYYPPLMSYFYLFPVVPVLLLWMLFSGMSSAELVSTVVLDPTIPWMAGRVLIALLGTLTVYLTYLLGNKIFGRRAGLLAAFFLATSFLHVSLSHFTRHWVPTAFFSLLVMIASYNVWKLGRNKDYVWSAVFVAMSFGVGFIGIVSGFFPVVAHFARHRLFDAIKSKKLWAFVIGVLLMVSIVIALYPQRFLEISQGTDISISESKSVIGFLESFAFHIKTLVLADPVIALLALVGVGIGLLSRNRFVWIFLIYSLLYISGLYFVIHNEPRYISFLYPGLAILAGTSMSVLWTRLKHRHLFIRAASALAVVVFLIYPLAVSGQFVALLNQNDTRIQAKKWIEENLPEGTKIISYIQPEVLIPNKQAIEFQASLDPLSLRTKDRVLLELPQERYPQSYQLLSFPRVLERGSFIPDYAALQYWNLDDYLEIPSDLKTSTDSVSFDSGLGTTSVDFLGNFDAPTFLMFGMQRLGPMIEIYKVR